MRSVKKDTLKRLGMENEFKKWALDIKTKHFFVGVKLKLIKKDNTLHSVVRLGTIAQVIGERSDGDIGRFLIKIDDRELYFNTEEMPIYFKRV